MAGRTVRLVDQEQTGHNPGIHETKKEDEMARRRTLTSTLYRAARISATGRSVRTGHAGRRAKNIIVGRALGRSGFWRWLWK